MRKRVSYGFKLSTSNLNSAVPVMNSTSPSLLLCLCSTPGDLFSVSKRIIFCRIKYILNCLRFFLFGDNLWWLVLVQNLNVSGILILISTKLILLTFHFHIVLKLLAILVFVALMSECWIFWATNFNINVVWITEYLIEMTKII